MLQYLTKFCQLFRKKGCVLNSSTSFLRQGIKFCHNDGSLVIIRKICLLLSSYSSICEWRSVSFMKNVFSWLTVTKSEETLFFYSRSSDPYVSYPLLTYPASSTFAVARSFLKIQFLFPKSQLNYVTCSCPCKRVWVTPVVYTKHWPAFLVWTWELLAQKKQLLQQFRMNRASGLPVSLHQCNCLA